MPIQRSASGGTTGAIQHFPATAPPPGWLKANGQSLLRASYPALWAYANASGLLVAQGVKALGQFGTGDGATTFTVPDVRGEFVRSSDDGKGVDAGRAGGTWQGDEFRSHTHGHAGDGINVTAGGQGVIYWGAGSQLSGASGGTETRPRNVALLACIKF